MDIRDIQWGGLHAIGMLLALWLSASILYHGRDILIPITGSILFAYLLLPLVRVLERWFNRPIFAIIVTLLGVFCVAAVIISLMVFELTSLYNDLPQLRETITTYVMGLQNIINRYTDINPQEQLSYISNWMGRSVDMLTAVVFQTLTSLVYAGGLIIFFIFYVVFFLLYRHRFFHFLLYLVSEPHHETVRFLVSEVQKTVSQYLIGIVTVMSILAVYNIIALHLLGVMYPLVWAIVGGLLYIIPYIGIALGSLLPAATALLIQQDPLRALGVVIIFTINQVIENNILTPYIVGARVQVNPVFVLLAFFVGGYVWGIAGMILFLPIVGVIKVICDNIPYLQPYGYLLGTDHNYTKTTAKKSGEL